MHLPSDWSLSRAASLRAEVERSLTDRLPGLRPTIQMLPSDVEPQCDEAIDAAS